MSDMDALQHVIEAFAHLQVAEQKARSEEVEKPIHELLNVAVDKRCEVVNRTSRNLAEGIDTADRTV